MNYSSLFNSIKDCWFLITLIFTVSCPLLYMIIYKVTPWDKYKDLKFKRLQLNFHNKLGIKLLESGAYLNAKTEFENALKIRTSDLLALNGKYLADLFLSVNLPTWKASIGLIIKNQLLKLKTINDFRLTHIVDGFIGRLYHKMGKYEIAKEYYKKAFSNNTDYIDAIILYSWMLYFSGDLAIVYNEMKYLFEKSINIDPFDFRGYHGLGYTYYIQAIHTSDKERAYNLLTNATKYCQEAKYLQINTLAILCDLGEISRCINPKLSIYYHESALQLIVDPKLNNLSQVCDPIGNTLIHKNEFVCIATYEHRISWIKYQLCLDFYAQMKIDTTLTNTLSHKCDKFLDEAQKTDPNKEIYPIYEDQLKTLEQFI